jgi:hypothetical protein
LQLSFRFTAHFHDPVPSKANDLGMEGEGIFDCAVYTLAGAVNLQLYLKNIGLNMELQVRVLKKPAIFLQEFLRTVRTLFYLSTALPTHKYNT